MSALRDRYDLAIVGSGPAGLSAATLAAQLGASTIVLDEQREPGGQIYRAITSTPLQDRKTLGEDYWHGESLIEPFRRSGAQYFPGATVWSISPAADDPQVHEIGLSAAGIAHVTRASAVILATGAQERPFPIPGWTLPGVLGAGGAQVLLKSAGLVPDVPVVIAGCGPLLYLIAWQFLNAGGRIEALLDTTPRGRLGEALPHAWSFLRSPYFAKGLKLLREVRANVRVVRHVTSLRAKGTERLERVCYAVGAEQHAIDASLLLLHQGVVANINLSNAVGCEHEWDPLLHYFRPKLDEWSATTVHNLWIAGDGGGIQGARAAEHRGRIAALAVAHALGQIDTARRDADVQAHRRALERAVAGRRFFDVLYSPPRSFRIPADETIACRCEEVTAAQIRAAVAHGCPGPNQMKSFLRCGMGPCQGRMCGLTVVDVIGDARGVDPAEVGYYRLRFPIKPLTLGELASLPQTEASKDAVVRVR
jgi:octopine oxidase subunit A